MMDKQQAKAAVVEEITAFVTEFHGLCEKHGIMAMAVGLGVKKDCGELGMNSGFVASAIKDLDCRQAAIFTKTLMQCAEVWSAELKKAKCVCADKAAAGHEKPVESWEMRVPNPGVREEPGTEPKTSDFEHVSVEEFVEFVNGWSPESRDLVKAVLTRFGLPREELEGFRKAFEAAKWKKDKDAVRAAGAGGPSVAIDPAMQAGGGGGDPKNYGQFVIRPKGWKDPRTHLLHYGMEGTKDLKAPIPVTEKQVEAWKVAIASKLVLTIVDAVSGETSFCGLPDVLVLATKIPFTE